MEQIYLNKMDELGYNQLVCHIFIDWENVKDEILIPDRKSGSGNGTIHVFLGAADSSLQEEFPAYYDAVENGEDPSVQAVKVKHYFLLSNIISMVGYVGQYYYTKNIDYLTPISTILTALEEFQDEDGLVSTTSFFKLSTGSNKLRPYFKQFDSGGVFTKVIRQLLLPNSSYKVSLFKNEEGEYAAFWLIGFDWLSEFEADSSSTHFSASVEKERKNIEKAYQQIFYGAPGTGKSNKVKEQTAEAEKEGRVFRTTFHPDSDYSTFVGCYKPTMKENVISKNGVETKEEQIVYRFVPQAFTNAYVKAWSTTEDVFLVIEEINRGNCAQIFGDLFQLLDRKDGVSEYPINADSDLRDHICKALEASERTDFPDGVKEGKKLVLPSNFYIWATMNTSDQSLFPIDSAFKRRWDWVYMPINTKKENWHIKVGGDLYSWTSFLEKVNNEILTDETAEDKHLGFYFCKAEGGEISQETFVGKVLFYLWNDVFKVYGIPSLKIGSSKEWAYTKFYNTDGTVNEQKVKDLMEKLGIES